MNDAIQTKRKLKRPTSRRSDKHTKPQIAGAPPAPLLQSAITIEEFRQLPVWNLAEFTQLCCGAPAEAFDPRTFTMTREIIKRAVIARKIPSVHFRPADPVEALLGVTFYEADMFFERDNPEVIAWARQTFPAFPADAVRAEEPAYDRSGKPEATTGLTVLGTATAETAANRDASTTVAANTTPHRMLATPSQLARRAEFLRNELDTRRIGISKLGGISAKTVRKILRGEDVIEGTLQKLARELRVDRALIP
jgi:hypothetical protein